jgi:ADP-heptose:LPS heptosyltransferase
MVCHESVGNFLKTLEENDRPYVALIPHLNLMEAIPCLPIFFGKFPRVGVVYRPLQNARMDRWLKRTRERFGLKLLSRKEGVYRILNALKSFRILGFLFDQSAGEAGVLTTFFGRLASATDLPEKCAERFGAGAILVYVERLGFWRGRIRVEPLSTESGSLTVAAHRWLEERLKEDRCFYENWLWWHDRWKIQQKPSQRFGIRQKRSILPQTLSAYGLRELPSATRVWIRMPNWLGDVVMVLPLLRALKASRPDFSFNFLVRAAYVDGMREMFPLETCRPLPEKGIRCWRTIWGYRRFYPEVWIGFTHSFRGDLEALCLGASQRFGIRRRFPRPFLTHVWSPGSEVRHQTWVGYEFLKHFGLSTSVSLEPFERPTLGPVRRVGIFAGSENCPEKRWPEGRWASFLKELSKCYPDAKFTLLGTERDVAVGEKIRNLCPMETVENRCGRTSLRELIECLRKMDGVVSNDTGGGHLANLLGLPLVVLYGPTSPEKTGPIFEGPKLLLTSPNGSMEGLESREVVQALVRWRNGL